MVLSFLQSFIFALYERKMNDDRLAMLPQAINQGEADNAYIL